MKCQLCLLDKPLADSHILPRSYIRFLKSSISKRRPVNQLIHVKAITNSPVLTNFNPTQKLLCFECEHLLKINYEDYGTIYLRSPKNLVNRENHIILNNFRFQTLYLYYLSILWRASVSTLDFFENVELHDMQEWLRQCVLNNKLTFEADGQSLPIQNFVHVRISRLIAHDIKQDAFDRVHINFWSLRENTNYQIGVLMNGFQINFFIPFTTKISQPGKFLGVLRDRALLRIPKIDYREITTVRNALDKTVVRQSIKPLP